MTVEQEQNIIRLARQYLAPYQPSDYQLIVEDTGVKEQGDWFVVPVHATKNDARPFDYYGRLAEAEADLEDALEMNVLLVPVRSN